MLSRWGTYLCSSLDNSFTGAPPFPSCKCRCNPQIMLYKVLGGYRSPSSLHTSWTNFVNQRFKDFGVILTMFVSKAWILSSSTWKPASSLLGSLFFLEACHSAKIFNDHLVTYHVDLGTDFSRNFLSSSSLLEFLKAVFGGITNDHDSSKEIMSTEAKSFDSKSSRRKQQNFCRLKCTRFLGFLKPHKNSHAHVFSGFWNSRKIRVHVFSRVFETVEKFAGRCYRGFLKLFKTLAARVLSGLKTRGVAECF